MFELQVKNYFAYDYVTLSYSSTLNVTLDYYAPDTILYNEENTVVPIAFSATPSFDGVSLVYHDTFFDRIIVTADVYKNDGIVQTTSIVISVLSTENGIYASCMGNSYCFEKYVAHLYENEFITAEQNALAKKSITEPILSYIGDEMTKSEVEAKLEASTLNDAPIKHYNASTDSFTITSIENTTMTNLNGVNAFASTTASTASTITVHRPIITVNYSIEALNSGSDNNYSLYISEIPKLTENVESTAYLGCEGDYWFEFTSDEAGEYQFCATGQPSLTVTVHDSVYGTVLGNGQPYLEMTAGQTVYVRVYDEGETYDDCINVRVEKVY